MSVCWTTRDWYPILKGSKEIVLSDDWVLYQTAEKTVQMVHHSGAMCVAEVEADGECRIRTSPEIAPLLDSVIGDLRKLLNLK